MRTAGKGAAAPETGRGTAGGVGSTAGGLSTASFESFSACSSDAT